MSTPAIQPPRFVVPQLYCTGPAPGKFKVPIGSRLFDPKWVRDIAVWKLSAVATTCLFAVDAFLQASEPIRARLIRQQADGRLFGLDFLRIALTVGAAGGVIVTFCIIICRVVKYRFNKTKPTDAEYQSYLRQLATHDIKDIAACIERTKFKFKNDPLMQPTIDGFLQVMCEEFLRMPWHSDSIQAVIGYASSETQKVIFQKTVNVLKMQDPYTTCVQVYMQCWEDSKRERLGSLEQGIDAKMAAIVEQFAEDEFIEEENIPCLENYLAALWQQVPHVLINTVLEYYTDCDIKKRIKRIYLYTVKTRYYDSDMQFFINSDVYYRLLGKLALLYVKHPTIRELDEEIALLKCLPNAQKLIVIQAMLQKTSYHSKSQELESMQRKAQAQVQDLEELAEATTPGLEATDKRLFKSISLVMKAHFQAQTAGFDAQLEAIKKGV